MNSVKEIAINDLSERLNKSPFLLVVDYAQTTVPQFNEARKRLREVGAKMTVAKNSFVRLAAKRAGLSEDIVKSLLGQSAIVTGAEDVAAAAKVLKTYQKESKRLAFRGGLIDGNFVDEAGANALADLPSKAQLQAQLLGVLLAPASQLVRTLNEPAASLARVLQAHADATKAA
ncbi:MAG: 50S ribosomal protein L10 [Verrucomicrobiales bacterium]